ncbi:MAG: hypothetical protein ABIK27_07860, partial [Bacteroidota bacterium]
NATLAKNKNLLKILKLLQQQNIKLFLQIHDFAEDGRPSAYFEDEYIPDCHYGVINSRDYNVMLKAGLKMEGLHKIFNMIRPMNMKPADISPKQHILYPIRALRRKNIGEAILLSLYFNNLEPLVITLPPNSPADIKSYRGWKQYVIKEGLNVKFDAGLHTDFETLVMSSKLFVTTSMMEGFGFSFLEPWVAQKYLWGRKLPEICQDFEKNGVRLNHLYTRLSIPLEWIGKDDFVNKQISCILKSSADFHYNLDNDKILSAVTQSVATNTIDFGLLDEQFQKQIISRLVMSPTDKTKLIALNPFLLNPTTVVNKDALIQHNSNTIIKHYNETIYSQNLITIYKHVINTPVKHRINKQVLLSEFFDLKSFSLLKWGDYVES